MSKHVRGVLAYRFQLCAVGGLVLAILSGLSAGCESPRDRPLEWSYIHPAIIAPSCATASCHSDLAETADLALDDADGALDELIERQYILPGDPDSPLLFLLEGDERPLMPPDAPLPAADVELIRAWIEEGAPP